MQQKPQRIISARTAAKRLGISRVALAKHLRRAVISPDFQSDTGLFFELANLPKLRQALEENRRRTWRHIPVKLQDGYVITR
jgi:hypothetical protein